MTNPSYPVAIIAKLLNLSERRVQQLAHQGIIPKAIKAKYELIPSIQGYIDYLKKKVAEKDISQNAALEAKVRLIKAHATRHEMATETLNKNLLPAKLVESSWSNLILRCRAVLLGIPNRLANQIVAINDPKEIAQILKDSIYEALTELSTTENIGEKNDDQETSAQDQELHSKVNS